MLLKFRSQYLISIGPHWYIFLIGIFLITGSSVFIGNMINNKNTLIIAGFWLLYSIIIVFYTLTALRNPGIIKKRQPKIDLEKLNNSNVIYTCQICYTEPQDQVKHCFECDVCIKNLDHHCVWVGKCVGKNNLCLFYCFVLSFPILMFYTMFVAISQA